MGTVAMIAKLLPGVLRVCELQEMDLRACTVEIKWWNHPGAGIVKVQVRHAVPLQNKCCSLEALQAQHAQHASPCMLWR